jgi:His-Xaa-Ser system protein HxsD
MVLLLRNMPRTPPTRHTPRTIRAAKSMAGEIVVDFSTATHPLSVLNAAAYRLLGVATCRIDKSGGHYFCHLQPTAKIDPDALRARFVALVTDENLREDLRAKTEPVRNLILSLAFGSLAEKSER